MRAATQPALFSTSIARSIANPLPMPPRSRDGVLANLHVIGWFEILHTTMRTHSSVWRTRVAIRSSLRDSLERPKLNERARGTGMSALRYKKIGDRPFTVTGSGWPHDRFDTEHSEP